MTIMHPQLLNEIESFLTDTGMGESYFGKASVGNSELVSRLRDGKRVWPETETRVFTFIKARRDCLPLKVGKQSGVCQGKVSHTATIGGEAQ